MSAEPRPPALRRLLLHPLPWILLAGLLLRAWNIDFGFPYYFHPDEPPKAGTIDRILQFQSPDYFLHPGLTINLASILSAIQVTLGADPGNKTYILAGRWVSVILGTLTIALTHRLGRRLGPECMAVGAAALLAAAPLHVVHCRYLKEDVPLTFAVCLAALAGLRLIQRGPEDVRRRDIALLGAAAGLCCAAKFVGVLMIPAAIVLVLRPPRQRTVARIGLLLASAAGAFLLASPQVLDMAVAGRDLSKEITNATSGGFRAPLNIWQWPDLGTYYFHASLAPGTTWLAALAGLAGLIMALRSPRALPAGWRWIAGLLLAWYILIELSPTKRAADVERYALPCLPFLLLFAARLTVDSSWCAGRWRAAALAACLLPAAIHSVTLTDSMKPDTRMIARRWMREHGPEPGQGIVMVNDTYAQEPIVRGSRLNCSLNWSSDKVREAAAQADWFIASSLYTDRYTGFPSLSPKQVRRYDIVRSDFPHLMYIGVPWYRRAGFHNPTFEIRSRQPFEGSLFDPVERPAE